MGKSSYVIQSCQVCGSSDLSPVLFLGFLPPVNQMHKLGSRPEEQPAYPAEVLLCSECQLVQLSLVVDPRVLFPPEYPYTSRATRILGENFSELCREAKALIELDSTSLVVDIGSNDGTLLSNFQVAGHRVHGIEPTERAHEANALGVPTTMAFFDSESAAKLIQEVGQAHIVTATNVFAHIDNLPMVVESIVSMLDPRGVFISESHYLHALLETLQYDTVYHEHLRYYSLQSLHYLFRRHGLEIIHAKRIPTHGGSVRVYAARPGTYHVQSSVAALLEAERAVPLETRLAEFKRRMVTSKLELLSLLSSVRQQGRTIVGIGAPSRASTLINYVGIDDGILDAVLEIRGSHKVGKYMPGTMIPVREEEYLFDRQPDVALILSWHIADELIPKLRARGYKGQFLIPLPQPRFV